MQDKELDAFFHSKLDDFEMEPSHDLWKGIAAELDSDKKKKNLKPYLSIAATIVVLLTAGTLFMPGKPKVTNQQVVKTNVSSKPQPVNNTPVQAKVIAPVQPVVKEQSPVESIAAAKTVKPKVKASTVKAEKAVAHTPVQPVVTEQEPVLAANTAKPDETLHPVVPDTDIALSQKTISAETEPFKTKPVVMASTTQPAAEKQATEQEPVKKKKRGFGGFMNSLIAKIDKRKDKLIEFKDGDGAITGINLGIIKITNEDK